MSFHDPISDNEKPTVSSNKWKTIEKFCDPNVDLVQTTMYKAIFCVLVFLKNSRLVDRGEV